MELIFGDLVAKSRELNRAVLDRPLWTPDYVAIISLNNELAQKLKDRCNLNLLPVYAEPLFDEAGNYIRPVRDLPLSDEQVYRAFKFLSVEDQTDRWTLYFNETGDICAGLHRIQPS